MEKALKDSKKTEEEVTTEVESKDESKDEVEETEVETKSEDSTSSKEEIDYDAIIAEENRRKEKAREDFERRKNSRVEKDDNDDDDKPITAKQLERILSQQREETRKQFEEERALEYARKHTTSEQEAQAALLYWKNRVVPTGNIEEDVAFAVAGLSYKRTVAKTAELARALKGKDASQRHAPGTERDTPTAPGPKLDAVTQASYIRAGFAYDQKLKAWTKKLPNGKFVYKDPKTKQILPLK